jgi:hypothetical protein
MTAESPQPDFEALNRDAPRFSADIDIFHDREERGVTKGAEGTRLEWVADSDCRFFPTVRDDLFGCVLHPVDLAANKAMAAAGRRELRDLVDQSPGFTPEGLIAEIRRNSRYPATEWLKLIGSEPIDPKDVQPDPGRWDRYRTRAGQRRARWPASAEISGAMPERYRKLPEA